MHAQATRYGCERKRQRPFGADQRRDRLHVIVTTSDQGSEDSSQLQLVPTFNTVLISSSSIQPWPKARNLPRRSCLIQLQNKDSTLSFAASKRSWEEIRSERS